tara:strand:- start:152 stop:505 length:354 start_codon:yes stop_codon:yes gene_type:complete
MRFLILLLTFGFLFGESVTLPESDFIELIKGLEELEYKDSLNVVLINELKLQIEDYEKLISHKNFVISEQDSLVLLLEKKYELCEKRLEEVEPGFFDNKYLWFLFGLFSQEGIKNIK